MQRERKVTRGGAARARGVEDIDEAKRVGSGSFIPFLKRFCFPSLTLRLRLFRFFPQGS
jgi:hypothetical protein